MNNKLVKDVSAIVGWFSLILIVFIGFLEGLTGNYIPAMVTVIGLLGLLLGGSSIVYFYLEGKYPSGKKRELTFLLIVLAVMLYDPYDLIWVVLGFTAVPFLVGSYRK